MKRESGENSTRATIYVVDDDDSVRRALRRLLMSVGYAVESFSCAEALLAEPLAPQCCVLLDVHLGRINGAACRESLLARDPAPPVVFISAHDDETTRGLSGASVLLRKPFDESELLAAVERALVQNDG